ncbi:large ribosomal subunit protein mL54 [Paralichthys olivaceus]|uniref:large ribosomal subunit protein mL54 n=1 Tax=Paralichthys olivaceus TaxID=8255 RepID=UPI00097D516E|nr:PREDICTED: 39S ribosomal protein L54, mitochondrial [Paralichthys olivaceus]
MFSLTQTEQKPEVESSYESQTVAWWAGACGEVKLKMSGYSLFRIAAFTQCATTHAAAAACRASVLPRTETRGYAKKVAAKGKGKGMAKEELKGPEVCKDPVRLTSHAVGVNIFKQGDDPTLKAPEEYPEWLYQLNLGEPKKLHELESDNLEYWKRLRKENIWRFNRLHKGKKF